MGQVKTIINNYLHAGIFLVIGGGFSSFSNGKKDVPACIFKRRSSFQYVLSLLFLFLSGRITLKVIFYYFHNYLFKVYKCINQHFGKPNQVLFQKYRCTPLSLHLSQWQIANETESLIQLHFAQIKRNPE